MSTTPIRTAVIPAAGLGTRLLPFTKAVPKEMLPIGDMPVIEHTVRELVASGITDITIVVSGRKDLVQQHFRPDDDLLLQLTTAGKDELAAAVRAVVDLNARISWVYQDGPYGNGTPIVNAASRLGSEPVMVLWPDDVFVSKVPRAQQLMDAYAITGAPVLALMPMDPADAPRYGVPIVEKDQGGGRLLVSGLVEKPKVEDAPSAYAAIGGYVITAPIIAELEQQTHRWYEHRKGEVYLTDAINAHAAKHPVFGQVLEGTWWDTGSRLDYLKAQIAAAFAHREFGPELRQFAIDLGAHADPDATI